MVAATVPTDAEAAKDSRVLVWDARNNDETSGWFWICMGMVMVLLMVFICESHCRRLSSAEGDVRGNAE